MGRYSTLIYLYNNFDEFETVAEESKTILNGDFDNIFKFIEENTKKVPDNVVQNILDFAKDY